MASRFVLPRPFRRLVRRRSLAWLAFVLVTALALRYLPQPRTTQSFPDGHYQVLAVIDGDTLRIEGDQRLRLISVDAPELNPGGQPEPFARDAHQAAIELISAAGWQVRIERCGRDERDKYGRLIRHVYLAAGERATMLDAELVRRGLARARDYRNGCLHLNMLREAEKNARANRLGMWAAQNARVE